MQIKVTIWSDFCRPTGLLACDSPRQVLPHRKTADSSYIGPMFYSSTSRLHHVSGDVISYPFPQGRVVRHLRRKTRSIPHASLRLRSGGAQSELIRAITACSQIRQIIDQIG
jgi:hypothetical protein